MANTTATPPPNTTANTTEAWTTTGLNDYEEVSMGSYNVVCTVLTVALNLYLVFIILTKVKIKRNIPCIPILCGSILGLLHGLGCNVMLTISFLNGSWVGSVDWCGVTAVLHKYVVFSIINCIVVVSLEAAFLISNPLSYRRETLVARRGMCIATFCALFVHLPITICKFFYLKPSNIIDVWGQDLWDTYGDKFYMYLHKFIICYRFFWPYTLDYKLLVYFPLTVNVISFLLIVLSIIIIVYVVCRGRQQSENRAQFSSTAQQEKTRQQQKKQNHTIALRAIVLTVGTSLPMLPNTVLSILFEVSNLNWKDEATLAIIDTSTYIYYMVPWLFPLLAIFLNPGILKAAKAMLKIKTSPKVGPPNNNTVMDMTSVQQ